MFRLFFSTDSQTINKKKRNKHRESNMGDCAQFGWINEWWNVICSFCVFHFAFRLLRTTFFFIYIFFAVSYASIFISVWYFNNIIALFLVAHTFVSLGNEKSSLILTVRCITHRNATSLMSINVRNSRYDCVW